MGGIFVPTKKFNGKLDDKPIKVIVVEKGYEKHIFAKPKNFDIATPHFVLPVKGTMEVHQDSPGNDSFRVMDVNYVTSGSFYSGSTFATILDQDFVVLPMNEESNGFAINTSRYGADISYPNDEKNWCLIAVGTFGTWQPKTQIK